MKHRSVKSRKRADLAVKGLSGIASLTGIGFLAWILIIIAVKGLDAISLEFFTQLPAPPMVPGGGLGNAILGTGIITLMATLIGMPIGLMAGVFLSEFGRDTRLAGVVRFSTNILMGTPSIIIGIFVYVLLVAPMGGFSGYAGAVALAVIMLPVVARTTEDMLNLVPDALRESALALGAPRWKMTVDVVFRAARTGLVTGSLLAVARVSGETAPLLFTALNSPFWPRFLSEPTANLTVTIFNYAMSPYGDWQAMAWGASLLITAGVLGVTVLVRTILRRRETA